MTIELISKSQNGDEGATLILIEKFKPLMKKYAYKLSYEDAYNDLLVDFIELIHNIQILYIYNKDEGGAVSYICTSIYNSYTKRLSGLLNLKKVILYSELNDAELFNIESKTSTNDVYQYFDMPSFFSVLTESETLVIKMIYYLGYTSTEIANICDISRQAVNQMKKRALKKLKVLVEEKPSKGAIA